MAQASRVNKLPLVCSRRGVLRWIGVENCVDLWRLFGQGIFKVLSRYKGVQVGEVKQTTSSANFWRVVETCGEL